MISVREDFSGNRNRPLSNVNTCVYIVNHSEPIPTGYVAIHSQNRLSRTSRTCSSLAVIKSFLLSILLLGRDIQLNPGPNWKYPGVICNKAVKRNQKGIQCDHCDLWYHTKCCSIGDEMYQILANSSCTWICVDCGLPLFFLTRYLRPH